MLNVDITVKPKVMFEIIFLHCQTRKTFFFFFFSCPPPPPHLPSSLSYVFFVGLCWSVDHVFFLCICMFLGFILTAMATVHMTMCILKSGFNFRRRLHVPVPAICNAWPVKNSGINVIFSYLSFCIWLFSLLYALSQYCCTVHKNWNKTWRERKKKGGRGRKKH